MSYFSYNAKVTKDGKQGFFSFPDLENYLSVKDISQGQLNEIESSLESFLLSQPNFELDNVLIKVGKENIRAKILFSH